MRVVFLSQRTNKATDKELRLFLKHGAFYGIGWASISLSGLILLPIYTHFLSPEELGVLELCSVIIALAAIFSTCSLPRSLLERCLHETSESGRSLWLRQTLTLTFLIASGVSAAFLLGRPLWNLWESMHPVWTLSLVIACVLWVESFLPIPKNYFRAKDESGRFASLNIVQGFLTVILITLAVLFLPQKKVEGILWARAGAVALTIGLAAGMTFKSLVGSYTLSGAKALLGFALPLIPTTVALLVLDSSDRFFLTYFHTLKEVGIYGLGYKLGMALLIPFTVTQLGLPQRLVAWNREESLKPQGKKFIGLYTCVIGGMALILILFAQEIVRLVAPPEFARASLVVGPVVLGSVALGSYSLLGSGVYVTGSTRPLMLATGSGVLVNVCLNFWAVPRWGGVGAAWTTLAAYAWMAFFVYWKVARKTPLQIQTLNIVKWILPVIALTAIMAWQPSMFDTMPWKVGLFGIYLLGAAIQLMHYAHKSK